MQREYAPVTRAFYPEREDAPEPLGDRWLAYLGFLAHSALSRRLPEQALLVAEVERHARRFAAGPLASRLPELRYRLRRDGFRFELIAECFGLYCAALSQHGVKEPAPDALGAGLVMIGGGIGQLGDPSGRTHALGLAATAHAICGTPVHVVTANDWRAQRAAAALRAPLESLGITVGCVAPGMNARARREAYSAPVVCVPCREIAMDYLRDRLHLGGARGRLAATFGQLAGDAPGRGELLLGGLHCALVEDADIVMLDDALAPLVIAADADQSQARLLYEQALELARALERGTHFTVEDDGTRLTGAGGERLERLVTPLGGVWAAPRRRDELIVMALDVLHVLRRDADYHVENGRVVFPRAEEGSPEEPEEASDALRKLIEIKEGCRLSGRRDVLARTSVPRFFRRYLDLAGVCADARGAEREFWALYRLRTTLVGAQQTTVTCAARMFTTAAAKWAALIETVRARTADGSSVLIALRSPEETQAVTAALKDAGVMPGLVRGVGDEAERLALSRLDAAGSVTLTVHPAERAVSRNGEGHAPLHLIVAEVHASERELAHVRRAYAASSCETMLSLEDKAVASCAGTVAWSAMRGAGTAEELPAWRAQWLARLVQRRAARAQALARQDVVSRDVYLRDLLAVSGARE